eukprot:TRINITY_DN214_c0_g1_i2.p2 TRINITY_DN214_c0_g1~~TRINITY_DN214_c0_g1_i2.p2  ORF type:complete len:459 (+),score=190.71 TRINITY_DN214_c0_g1_i2:2459-3835(+)
MSSEIKRSSGSSDEEVTGRSSGDSTHSASPKVPHFKKSWSEFLARGFKKSSHKKKQSPPSTPVPSQSNDLDSPLTEEEYISLRMMIEETERPSMGGKEPSPSLIIEDNLMDSKKMDIGQDVDLWNSLLPETFALPAQSFKTNVNKVAILFNPKSGNKRGAKLAEMSASVMETNCINVTLIELQRKGHAEELMETMDVTLYDVVCILGGDGTFHEAVNGYMKRKDDARSKVPLAILPGGTGNSLVLEFSGSANLKTAVEHVMRGLSAPIDIGELYYPTLHKKMYSFNSLHFGMASKVNEHAEKLRWMGKAARYTTAAVMELINGKKDNMTLEYVDKEGNRSKVNGKYSLLIANNIRTAAKGMKIAPDAKINDGLIDLILVKSSKTIDLARIFQGFYDGTHVHLEYVDYLQVKEFSVISFTESEGESLDVSEDLLDVDGELTGTTPFKCTMMKQAIRVVV